MTPRRLDADGVTQKLAAMDEFLADLAGVTTAGEGALAASRTNRNVAERAIIGLVDLAAGINAHLAAASNAPAPASYRESFTTLADIGVIDPSLAARLERAAGMRNVLVHLYVDVDPAVVADAVPEAIVDFRAYVRAVARWLLERA